MIVFESDPGPYLDRVRRARAMQERLQSGESVDIQDFGRRWKALLAEAPVVELVPSARYRIRVFAGKLELKHMHGIDEAGAVHGFDVPKIENMEFTEIEGVYGGRIGPGPFDGLLGIVLDSGKLAALADMDVLRVERL